MKTKLKLFKAFDKLQKKFLFPEEGFSILGEITCFDLIGQQLKAATPEKSTLERLKDVELIEAIGKKDVKGKMIFEGDYDSDGLFVQWCENCNSFEFGSFDLGHTNDIYENCHRCAGDSMLNDDIATFEVVGNLLEL